MSSFLPNHSLFYYDYVVTTSNQYINFNEGSGELSVKIAVGSYTLTDFATAIAAALNNVGALTYSVTVDRVARKLTISADGAFSLLAGTGTQKDLGAFELMGYNAVDTSSATSHIADNQTGKAFTPQFPLQSYVPTEDWRMFLDATVNKTASGKIKVVKFGTEKFAQFEIMYQTDVQQNEGVTIKNDPNGVANLRDFMNYLITKGPLEFMPSEKDKNTLYNLILESTPDSQTGTGFKIQEMYDMGHVGYFKTGVLKFRDSDVT